MKRNFSRPVPFSKKLIIIILLLLMILPSMPVQAGVLPLPTAETVNYNFYITAKMKAYREGAPVCPGDKVTFIVNAWRSGTSRDSRYDIPQTPAFGVPIDVLPLTGNVIQLSSANKAMTSLDLDLPGAVEFTFTAKKPGKANVTFEAMFPEKQVDAETRSTLSRADLNEVLYADVRTSVEVIECPLEVTAVNHYITKHGGLSQKITTKVIRAPLMQADTEGKLFVYEGVETVVIREKIPSCTVSWKTTERFVRIEAVKNENGYHVTIERGPMSVEVTHKCPDGGNTTSIDIPDGGIQEWDIPLNGGVQKQKMIVPPATTFYWTIALKVTKKQ